MSQLETPLTLRYWQGIGGTLIEEFLLVPRSSSNGPRRADAVIVPRWETKRLPAGQRDVDVSDQDVIVVQTKAERLSMPLLGQALFSAELLKKRHTVRSVRSVALCTKDDSALREVLRGFPNIEVVVYEEE